jgi:hypothetical protein
MVGLQGIVNQASGESLRLLEGARSDANLRSRHGNQRDRGARGLSRDGSLQRCVLLCATQFLLPSQRIALSATHTRLSGVRPFACVGAHQQSPSPCSAAPGQRVSQQHLLRQVCGGLGPPEGPHSVGHTHELPSLGLSSSSSCSSSSASLP